MDTKKDFEFEELIICGCCKQKFNDTEFVPKELSCKHCFCLRCVKTTMLKGLEVYCINCWKRTELDEQSPETLRTQNSILSLIRHLANVKVNKSVDKERKVSLLVKKYTLYHYIFPSFRVKIVIHMECHFHFGVIIVSNYCVEHVELNPII